MTKLSPSGNSLLYSTYLGCSSNDFGNDIAVDGSGSAYVTGSTYSTDFPTKNPYQTDQPDADVFVTKLSPSGNSLVYSTYLGGNSDEGGHGIALDGSGSAYVTGGTGSTDFPTQNPYQMDQTGYDAFLAKLSPSGNSLVYSTYLGGSLNDFGLSIALDGSGSAYVTGYTESTDFPTQNPYQTNQPRVDVFVTKLRFSMDFFTLAPCRLIDTRNATGPYGGPAQWRARIDLHPGRTVRHPRNGAGGLGERHGDGAERHRQPPPLPGGHDLARGVLDQLRGRADSWEQRDRVAERRGSAHRPLCPGLGNR